MKQAYNTKGEIAILRKNGQLVMPKKIRDAKKLKAGDLLRIHHVAKGTFILEKQNGRGSYIMLKAVTPKFDAEKV